MIDLLEEMEELTEQYTHFESDKDWQIIYLQQSDVYNKIKHSLVTNINKNEVEQSKRINVTKQQ